MLILSRKLNESIVIDGNTVVTILGIERNTIKLGIMAPKEVRVLRSELVDDGSQFPPCQSGRHGGRTE